MLASSPPTASATTAQSAARRQCLGTGDFVRVRVGINPGVGKAEADFLLHPLGREQSAELDELLDYAAQAVAAIISEGAEKAMTKFNRRAQGEPSEEK